MRSVWACLAVGAAVTLLLAVGMLIASGGPAFHGSRSIEDGDLLPLPDGLRLEADGLDDCGSLECGRSFLVSSENQPPHAVADLLIDHLVSAHGWGELQDELRADGGACIEDGYLCVHVNPVGRSERTNSGRWYDLDGAEVNALPDDLAEIGFSSCCGEDFTPWSGSLPGSRFQLASLVACAFVTTAGCRLIRPRVPLSLAESPTAR